MRHRIGPVGALAIVLLLAACSPTRSSITPTSTTAPTSAPSSLGPGSTVPFTSVTPSSGAGRRIGLVGPLASDPFAAAVTESILGQAKRAGLDVSECDSGNDAALLLECARRMTTQQVEGWIVLQPGNSGPALCAVAPASVPLLVVGSAPLACATAVLSADDARAGFLIGAALGRLAALGGACASSGFVIVGDAADTAASLGRAAGVTSGLTSVCPHATPTRIDIDPSVSDEQALAATLAAPKDPQPVLVAAVDDAAALNVVAAVPGDHAGRVTLVSVGADQRARCLIAGGGIWWGDAALFPDRYGEVVVPALLDAMAGRPVPPVMNVPSVFVTSANLGNYYDLSTCPSR